MSDELNMFFDEDPNEDDEERRKKRNEDERTRYHTDEVYSSAHKKAAERYRIRNWEKCNAVATAYLHDPEHRAAHNARRRLHTLERKRDRLELRLLNLKTTLVHEVLHYGDTDRLLDLIGRMKLLQEEIRSLATKIDSFDYIDGRTYEGRCRSGRSQ